MKRCRRCDLELPLEDFPPHRFTTDRRSSWCRSCHLEATREWRARELEAGRRTAGGRKRS